MTAEWHYHGHYGNLGPLTREQIDELVEAGVILRETWVWRNGMADWLPAAQVPELQKFFEASARSVPPPLPQNRPPTYAMPQPSSRSFMQEPPPLTHLGYAPLANVPGTRSRILAGVFQLIIPGVGRMYLGYWWMGILQLLVPCAGAIWSYVDGVIILTGGVRMDAEGRPLKD